MSLLSCGAGVCSSVLSLAPGALRKEGLGLESPPCRNRWRRLWRAAAAARSALQLWLPLRDLAALPLLMASRGGIAAALSVSQATAAYIMAERAAGGANDWRSCGRSQQRRRGWALAAFAIRSLALLYAFRGERGGRELFLQRHYVTANDMPCWQGVNCKTKTVRWRRWLQLCLQNLRCACHLSEADDGTLEACGDRGCLGALPRSAPWDGTRHAADALRVERGQTNDGGGVSFRGDNKHLGFIERGVQLYLMY